MQCNVNLRIYFALFSIEYVVRIMRRSLNGSLIAINVDYLGLDIFMCLAFFRNFPLTLSSGPTNKTANLPGFEGFLRLLCVPTTQIPLRPLRHTTPQSLPFSQAASHHLFAYALTYLPRPAKRVIKFKIFKHILRVGQNTKKKMNNKNVKKAGIKWKSHKKRAIDQLHEKRGKTSNNERENNNNKKINCKCKKWRAN